MASAIRSGCGFSSSCAAGELTVGELVGRLSVSNHLACLRWYGFIEARREGRTVYNWIADERVGAMLELGESLLADNAEHVGACCQSWPVSSAKRHPPQRRSRRWLRVAAVR